MNGMRHIVCATDLSPASRLAVERACLLASLRKCGLTVAHVVNQGALGELRRLLGARAPETEPRVLDQFRTELDSLVDACTTRTGVVADRRLAVGRVVDEVLLLAEQLDAGLIVVGCRGSGDLRSLLPGTIASRMVRKASRPVLVVRKPAPAAYRRPMVAVDFSDAAQQAVRAAREVAPAARILLCHAFEVPFENHLRLADVAEDAIQRYRSEARSEATQQLAAFASRTGLAEESFDITALCGQPSRAVVDRAKEGDVDLVAVGKRGLGAVERLLLGSVAQHVLAESDIDVLVSG